MAKKKEKPLTREDVLKMIEEHGGPEGLDLSERNLEGIDLSSENIDTPIDLHDIILRKAILSGAKLWNANLEGANLSHANVQGADLVIANLKGANLSRTNLNNANLASAILQDAGLSNANLENANLAEADLQNARLSMANLKGARLLNANLQGTHLMEADLDGAMLVGVKWHPKYIIGDENLRIYGEENLDKKERDQGRRRILGYIAGVYCNLKNVHHAAGMYDVAGAFYFREMTVRRKALKWWPNPLPRALSKFISVFCGYGESPLRVVISAVTVVLGMAIGIWAASALTFLDSLYYSAVSFTALGYGLWVSPPEGWVKALGAAEAFIGVFMIALFLITFVRKMTR